MKRKSDSQKSRTNWNLSNYTHLAMLTLLIAMLAINIGTVTGTESNLFNAANAPKPEGQVRMDMDDEEDFQLATPQVLTADIYQPRTQGFNEVELNWNSTGYVEGFIIERRVFADPAEPHLAEPWRIIAIVGGIELQYTDLVWQNLKHAYRVKAFRGSQQSEYSNKAVVRP